MQNTLPSSATHVENKSSQPSSFNSLWINKRPRSDEAGQKSYKPQGIWKGKMDQSRQSVPKMLDLGDVIKTCMDIKRISVNHFTFNVDDDISNVTKEVQICDTGEQTVVKVTDNMNTQAMSMKEGGKVGSVANADWRCLIGLCQPSSFSIILLKS